MISLLHECHHDPQAARRGQAAPAQYAEVVALRLCGGQPIGSMDALIASITRVSGARLATRYVADFERLGLDLVAPWAAP